MYRKTIVAVPAKHCFSSLLPNYGITTELDSIRELANEEERMGNATATAVEALTAELVATHTRVLQNRLAFDFPLVDKGWGLCNGGGTVLYLHPVFLHCGC